jgi:hypothetical protein
VEAQSAIADGALGRAHERLLASLAASSFRIWSCSCLLRRQASAWVLAHALAPETQHLRPDLTDEALMDLVKPKDQEAANVSSPKEVSKEVRTSLKVLSKDCVSTSAQIPSDWCARTCTSDPAGEACSSTCKCPAALLKQHEAEAAQAASAREVLVREGNWPRVFLLGTQKGASTAFARAFEHAGLCSSMQGKECHVLVKEISNQEYPINASTAVAKYTSQFVDRDFSGHDNCSDHYDGNPFLLTDRGAPIFLHSFMPHHLQPKVRLVASLREPAGRMLSWHNHHRFTGPDPRVFAAHVAQEIEVWMSNGKLENAHNGVQNFWDDDSSNQLWVHSPPLDMMIGMYERGISWWRKHWHRDQLFVMNYDHFVSDNTTLLREIGRFTGLDLLDTPMPRVNLHSQTARSIAAMCCETYCALQLAAFTDSNARLYEMMDADAEDGAGPQGEPAFGRFEVPECVACGNTSKAELLAGCLPAVDDGAMKNSTLGGATARGGNGASRRRHAAAPRTL